MTVTPASGPFNGSTTVSGTLVNTYTNQPVPNEPVTLTAQRNAVLHGDDERHRRRILLRHAERAVRDVLHDRIVPRGLEPDAPALPTSGSSTFTVTMAPTTFDLHRHDVCDQRPIGHPLRRADDQ